MKRLFALAFVCMFTAFWSTPASADMLIYEPFDYSPGSAIIGQTDSYGPNTGTWAQAGTTGTAVHQVIAGSLTGPSGYPASIGNAADLKGGTAGDYTEYARLPLNYTAYTDSTLYWSLLINVPTTSGLTVPHSNLVAANDGIISFNNTTGSGARPSNFAGELVMRLGSTSGTFNLGIHASTASPNGTGWDSLDLTPGMTYLVVGRYAQGPTAGSGTDDSNDLWIDPLPATFGVGEGGVPTPDASYNGGFNSNAGVDYITSVVIGAGIASRADPNDTYIDELRVGTTWADVTSVPEPSIFALAGLGLLGLVMRYRARGR